MSKIKYIKDNKIYNPPIKLNIDGITKYTNKQQIILQNGYQIYQPPKRSLQSLISDSDNRINKETDQKILNKFIYKDNEFYLTMQNQTNFANMFIARQFLTYPQKVKTKTGFMQLKNIEQVQEFYLSGVNFIKQCLQQGWEKKQRNANRLKTQYDKDI